MTTREEIVAEFWTKIKGHDVDLHNGMTSWLRATLACLETQVARETWIKAANSLKRFIESANCDECSTCEVYKSCVSHIGDAARMDGHDLSTPTSLINGGKETE